MVGAARGEVVISRPYEDSYRKCALPLPHTPTPTPTPTDSLQVLAAERALAQQREDARKHAAEAIRLREALEESASRAPPTPASGRHRVSESAPAAGHGAGGVAESAAEALRAWERAYEGAKSDADAWRAECERLEREAEEVVAREREARAAMEELERRERGERKEREGQSREVGWWGVMGVDGGCVDGCAGGHLERHGCDFLSFSCP